MLCLEDVEKSFVLERSDYMSWDINIKDKKVIYTHNCEACQRHGYPDLHEECEMCGYTGKDIEYKLRLADQFNYAHKMVYGEN